MRQDVADRVAVRAQPLPHADHLGQVRDVPLHGHECDAEPGQAGAVRHALLPEPGQVLGHLGQGIPEADVGVALGRRPVDGDPEAVEPDPDELVPGLLVQPGPVRDELDSAPDRLRLREHRQEVRVREGLPEPAEEDGRERARAPARRR